MRQRRKREVLAGRLALRKETVRVLDQKALDDQELAQVAGGTWYPKRTCTCTN